MDASSNALNWFEISVSDMARAKKFYEQAFTIELQDSEMMGMKMAFFPGDPMNGKVSGGLVEGPYHKPSADGAKIYLNANPDMETVIKNIEAAGGQITMPRMLISEEIGYMAFFIDSEGNNVALHSNK